MIKDIRKILYIFPTLVTLTGMFFGFSSIIISATAYSNHDYYRAAVAIILAMICDIFDGRVARITKTQSDFGIQIDSLSDVVCFGVAPALMVYRWGLSELSSWGALAAAIFLFAGAMRLARFNVHASQGKTSGKYYLGLPIPAAAGMLASLVILHNQFGEAPVNHPVNVLWVVIILAYLMVSNVRYRTFKKLRPSSATFALTVSLLIAAWFIAVKFSPPFLLVAVASAYISSGLIEEFILFPKPKLKIRLKRREEAAEEPIDLELDMEGLDGESEESLSIDEEGKAERADG
ncbi:MAG: CDP-diacylglycerol--serine O-phosphatidyltransferase [Myxococcota bacterium]